MPRALALPLLALALLSLSGCGNDGFQTRQVEPGPDYSRLHQNCGINPTAPPCNTPCREMPASFPPCTSPSMLPSGASTPQGILSR